MLHQESCNDCKALALGSALRLKLVCQKMRQLNSNIYLIFLKITGFCTVSKTGIHNDHQQGRVDLHLFPPLYYSYEASQKRIFPVSLLNSD